MRSALLVVRPFAPIALAAALLGTSAMATAQSAPDRENGRYTMVPTGDGVLRLDTRSGTVSTCKNSETGWACYAVPDERAAWDAEIGRLQAEVERLKGQLAAREQAQADAGASQRNAQPPRPPESRSGEPRKIEIPLPSDQDVERVMTFLERAWRRLIDLANQVQKDVSGKI